MIGSSGGAWLKRRSWLVDWLLVVQFIAFWPRLLLHLIFLNLNPDWMVSDAWLAVNQSVVKATVLFLSKTLDVNWENRKRQERSTDPRIVPEPLSSVISDKLTSDLFQLVETDLRLVWTGWSWPLTCLHWPFICSYLLSVDGEPERWKWTICHFPSRRCHTLVSSDWAVRGVPLVSMYCVTLM